MANTVGRALVSAQQTGSHACVRPILELAGLLVCHLMPEVLPGPQLPATLLTLVRLQDGRKFSKLAYAFYDVWCG